MQKKAILVSVATLFLGAGTAGATDIMAHGESQSNNSAPIVNTIAIHNPDPYSAYNKKVHSMNATLDKYIVRPIAVWYITYIPDPLRLAVNNFYNNLRDFVTLGNDVLQLNGMASMQNVMRIGINSLFGIVGIIDVASSLGLMRHKNSFGTTLKVYGWKNSNYFVIPLLGPSTVRDALGLIPDIYFNPTWYFLNNDYVSVGLFAINAIDTRSQFLGFDQVLNTSIDPYVTMRDTYLQSIGEKVPDTDSESDSVSIGALLDASTESNAESISTRPKV